MTLGYIEMVTHTDKTKEMLDSWCEAKGVEFGGKEAEAACKRKAPRVADVIQLKVPGRGIPSNHIYQFQEQEYVKAEEFVGRQVRYCRTMLWVMARPLTFAREGTCCRT